MDVYYKIHFGINIQVVTTPKEGTTFSKLFEGTSISLHFMKEMKTATRALVVLDSSL